jgi:hypothetical protein
MALIDYHESTKSEKNEKEKKDFLCLSVCIRG